MDISDEDLRKFISNLPFKGLEFCKTETKAEALNRQKNAVRIWKRYGVPLTAAPSLSDDGNSLQSLRRHDTLTDFLQSFPEDIKLDLGGFSATYRAASISAGYRPPNENGKKSLRSLVDIFGCAYFGDEFLQELPLYNVFHTIGAGPASKYRYGSFGYLDIGIVEVDGVDSMMIVNAQTRKQYYKMPNNLKKKAGKWYKQAIEVLSSVAIDAGFNRIAIPSNKLVGNSQRVEWGQNHIPNESILNIFYDGFADGRGYERKKATLTHPVSQLSVTGDVWMKRLTREY